MKGIPDHEDERFPMPSFAVEGSLLLVSFCPVKDTELSGVFSGEGESEVWQERTACPLNIYCQ